MLDFNSKSQLSDRINYYIDQVIDNQKETPREYLGASMIGHQCERHIQYYWMNLLEGITPTFPARIKRVFDRGNVYEDKARRWLKDAGFIFGWVQDQHPVNGFVDGQFSGHADGVITGWKRGEGCPIQLPVLWECKCLKDKSWKEMVKGGLHNYSSTTYWAQIHVYMHYLKLPACLFTSVNADSMELHHELIQFNQAEADLFRYRSQRIFNSTDMGELLPRHTKDRSHYICKFCDYSARCWNE